MDKETISQIRDLKIRRASTEATDFALAKYLINEKGWKSIIYGAGNYGKIVSHYLVGTERLRVDSCLDMHKRNDKEMDVKVIQRDEYSEFQSPTVIFIAVKAYYDALERTDITSYIDKFDKKLIVDIMPMLDNLVKEPFYTYFRNNLDVLVDNSKILDDQISRETYFEYIKAILSGEKYSGPTFSEKDKYFGTGETKDLFTFEKDMNWVNCGSAKGDTIFHFLEKKIPFGKIYAIEGDMKRCEELDRNLSYVNDIRERIEIWNCFCGNSSKKITDIVGTDRISLINMDIEGAEVDALISARDIIVRDHPVLAICVYHKKDDLLVIPQIIKEMRRDYKFVLRKYDSEPGSYFNAINRLNEFVLYAI